MQQACSSIRSKMNALNAFIPVHIHYPGPGVTLTLTVTLPAGELHDHKVLQVRKPSDQY